MPAKKYRVFLNGKKRSNLKRLVNTGTAKARKKKCSAIGELDHPLSNTM